MCQQQYENSVEITKLKVAKVKANAQIYEIDTASIRKIKQQIKSRTIESNRKLLSDLKLNITCPQKQRMIEAASETGASAWLTSLPLKSNGFYLEKQAFWDATRIRYNLPLQRIPKICSCGSPFDIQHAFNCHKGGMVISRTQ